MFRLIKKVVIALDSIVHVFYHRKCVSLNNQPCMTRPTLIDFNHGECNQGLRFCSFMVNLDRYNGCCNSLDDPSGKICV